MANLKNVIYLSNEDYETLVSTGTVTIDGETLTYDENNVYITPDKLASTTEDGLMSASDKSKLDNIESGAQVNVQSDWNQTDIGADDYIKNKPEVDTDFSLTSTNALQNKVISEKLEYIDYALTHIKYKLFGVTTLSEIDYKVNYATIYPIPDTLSDDDGAHRVVYSDTQLKEVEGNSVVFNQLFNPRIDLATSINGLTITYNNETGVIHVEGTATANTNYRLSSTYNYSLSLLSSHTYLLKGLKTSGSQNTIDLRFSGSLQNRYDTGNGIIFTGLEDTGNINLYVKEGKTVNFDVIPQFFDITLVPLDISSVEEFNRIFPNNYYPYNAGEIKNTVIKGVKVNGYNLFDGIYEEGTISLSTGQNYLSSTTKRTPNYIKIISGQTYTFEVDNNGNHYLYEYDANKNYIKSTKYEGSTYTNNIQLTANTVFVRFVVDNATNNSCLHLTGTRTGYAPYKEPRIINIPQTELPSANSVHDTIKIVEGNIVAGQQRYNMVYVSKVASDDLGALDWVYVGTSYNAYAQLPSAKKVSSSVLSNILCSNYKVYKEDDITAQTKGISFANVLIIKDSSLDGKTAEEIKTAMSGVILNYEKNEYTETTLATDLTFEEVAAIIEQGGSIETIFEIVPPNLKTAFVVNKVIVS